jgi:hypothetical protein
LIRHTLARLTAWFTKNRLEVGCWRGDPYALSRVMHWPLDDEDDA